MSRRFTVIEVSTIHGSVKGRDNLGGIFTNRTPIEAAKKAASRICSMSEIHGQCTLVIKIREITRGSAQKEYTYKVKRIKVNKHVMKGDQEIVFHYMTHATSMNMNKK